MKKFLKISLIVGISSGVIYLGIGYGLSLFSTVEKPSGQEESIAFDKLRNNEQNLSVPSLEGYQTRDGTDQYYRYYESEADKVVILVHGSGYHSKYLASLANYLSGEVWQRYIRPIYEAMVPIPKTVEISIISVRLKKI